ncbi:hypothetical protein NLG42_20545 [Flavobacterium plurextorum]|uniref:hypothetical protein n=1 Tax=Flavobacterium TaxID=237 RepID=UPI00214D7812|nr:MULTISPECIES: hypothetical protein [Flavobacterium]UUW08482.1 hypothetical protein NLG42_20545 [Flavobacterium plurextorum]
MKKIKFIIGVFFIVFSANAQAVIGKTAPEGSGIVDFNVGGKSGIVLPWVTTLPTGTALTGGVMLFDANKKKVVYFNDTNWVDLSRRTGAVDLSIQESVPEAATKGTVIGAESSSVDGVLVLESSNKALILPRMVSPHLTIVKPMAGTICYGTKKKMVCVYNGTEWTFWK